MKLSEAYADRYPGTVHLLRTLEPNPNLPRPLLSIAAKVAGLAQEMVDSVGDGPELSTGLRKLREAKDCFVLQALVDQEAGE